MRTDIGHFSLSYGDQEYELIPSFKNMRSICEPEEMPAFFANIFGEQVNKAADAKPTTNAHVNGLAKKIIYSAVNDLHEKASLVIQCCCDLDTSKLTGFPSYANGRKAWRNGYMDHENMIHIARAMLIHGVAGKPDPDNRAQKGKVTQSIDVYRYVEMAIAHLEMSYSDAERLTKTEFDRLIDAKYPDAKKGGNDAPTLSEHEQSMKWLDEVNKRREAAKVVA